MRALWFLAAIGCSAEPEARPDAFVPTDFCQLWVCFDATVWQLPPSPVIGSGACVPNYDGVMPVETCAYGCRTNITQPAQELCAPGPLAAFACAPPASCASGDTFACRADVGCELGMTEVTFGSCACEGAGGWACTATCTDGLCGAAALQQAITGTWRGTATHFAETYPVTLEVSADGLWRMSSEATGETFGGGGTPGSYLSIQAQTATGGAGVIAVFEASRLLPILRVRVTGTRLRFEIGWDTMCTVFAVFDLQRT